MAPRPARSVISSGQWRSRKHDEIDAAKEAVRNAEIEEYHRLLYVAMTRAQDRLYICGWRGKNQLPDGCWYTLIDKGLAGLLSPAEGVDGTPVRRLELKPPGAGRGRQGCDDRGAVDRTPRLGAETRATGAVTVRAPSLAACRGAGRVVSDRGRAGSARAELRSRTMRVSHAGAWCMRCCSICPSLASRIESGRREPSSRRAAPICRKPSGTRSSLRRSPVANDPKFAPLFAEGSLAEVPVVAVAPRGARTRSRSAARSTGWPCSAMSS